jgi:hypothetical protein
METYFWGITANNAEHVDGGGTNRLIKVVTNPFVRVAILATAAPTTDAWAELNNGKRPGSMLGL